MSEPSERSEPSTFVRNQASMREFIGSTNKNLEGIHKLCSSTEAIELKCKIKR